MAKASAPGERPKRFCAFFFGNGVALPNKKNPTGKNPAETESPYKNSSEKNAADAEQGLSLIHI